MAPSSVKFIIRVDEVSQLGLLIAAPVIPDVYNRVWARTAMSTDEQVYLTTGRNIHDEIKAIVKWS